MTPDQERRLEELFDAACALSLEARAAFLDRACAGDAELRQEVESLLAAHEQAGDYLLHPVANGARAAQKTVLLPPLSEVAGTRIGRYKLLEQIGEGGFGVVWMAEQEEPVRRRVALKIIKLGMDTREVVARFEAERQALAMMDHPNIASVFDGGATDTGRPYFVMELVKGVPITDYCDANKLSTRERLELFMQVCQAVQHAHQKGVIHRDLKPSNILVTVKDDRPVPKVIDFGVAKATQARLTEKTVFTRFHQWIGTPAYMSPEQAGLGSLDVDTRSDVYSLGVLLYELLTGRPPFDMQKLLAAGYDAVMRTIREEEPPKPSTRLSTLGDEELSLVAAKRSAEPAKLGRLVRGDVDWIVMKALEKDRSHRYETAIALAHDVERHLRAEPVSAAAPDLFYRAGKFMRRNRARLAFGALATVAVALAIIGGKFALNDQTSRQADRATGTNAVFILAKSGDAKALRRLLDANPRLANERDAEGSTPLAYAAGAGNTNALPLLLACGAAVDATNRSGRTPLLEAAANNQGGAVVALLAAGANPNFAELSGATALHAASIFGSTETARALLSKGARTDAVALPAKITALQQAAMLGHADLVELLLDHGARADMRDVNGNTPLHAAASGQSAMGVVRDWNRKLLSVATRESNNQGLASAAAEVSNRLARVEATLLPAMLHSGGDHRRVAELLLMHQADPEATNRDGCTPLLTAALFTNLPVAEVLVTHKANLNARAKDGSTPMNFLALKGNVPIAELLLQAGADANLQDDQGFTPLNTAVEHEHPDIAKALLTHGANPNLARLNGQTPMHTAADHGDIEMLGLLLDHGAALHPLENAGTPLSVAVQFDHIEAVKFLLRRGAKPDVASPQSGMTSLHWAATLGRAELVKLLLGAEATCDSDSSWQGTPLNAAAAGRAGAQKLLASAYAQIPSGAKLLQLDLGSSADYLAVMKMLLAAKANVNARESRYDRTPLFAAVNQGQADGVEMLLGAGADLAMADRMGQTPLHAACEMEASATVVSNIVNRLIRGGADVEARDRFRGRPLHAAANAGRGIMVALLLEAGARINAAGPNLCTPLQLAVMRGSRDAAELLLRKRPDLEWRNGDGTTALHQAAQLQSQEMVALLLDHGAEVETGTTNGSTALMVSASLGDVDTMKLLAKHGAKVNAVNDNGFTALLITAEAGKIESAKWLLEQGAKFDVAERTGYTPLILAARGGHLEMVRFLLDHGAKLDARNNVGFTALHEAADRGHAEMVAFLLDRGMEVDVRCDLGGTPLSNAANGCFTNETRYVAVVKVLLAHGADVNARRRGNQTPLHRAAEWGRPQILQALLAAGADPNARDDDGKTVLDLAKVSDDPRLRPGVAAGRQECAELLRKAAAGVTPTTFDKKTKP